MLVRIVKMHFQEDKTDQFLLNFEKIKKKIIAYPGCLLLELYRDKQDPCIFFTYSHWDSETHLNAYRKSPMFGEVWKKTKAMFASKPEAWSLDRLERLR